MRISDWSSDVCSSDLVTSADAARQAVENYLAANQRKSLLRFITCGSVDDGKSTLIGRLLYDSKLLFEDQLAALQRESKTAGTQDGGLDFALLVDGLGRSEGRRVGKEGVSTGKDGGARY